MDTKLAMAADYTKRDRAVIQSILEEAFKFYGYYGDNSNRKTVTTVQVSFHFLLDMIGYLDLMIFRMHKRHLKEHWQLVSGMHY